MPTYDFKCEKCGTTVEMQRAFDEETSPVCAPCGSTMSRVWNAPAVQFKGGGWGGQ